MTEPLIIGVPSKGRLQENTVAFFARAGLQIKQPGGARNYRGRLAGVANVEIAFLSASEIAKEIAAGHVHMGVTGLDLVKETIADWETKCHLVTKLGFGQADVVVAVPDSWIDVESILDLADVAVDFRNRHGRSMRVATKYLTLTRTFFADQGIADYRIVESLGATEGAPAAGTAELIVDITTTGSTLRANRLKIPQDGVILESEAHLVAARSASWSAEALNAARVILDRVAADQDAQQRVELRFDQGYDPVLIAELEDKYQVLDPFGAEARPVTLLCPREHRHHVIDALRTGGATYVMVNEIGDLFRAEQPMFKALQEAL